MQKKLILASASPTRKKILLETGLAFDVIPSDYEENMTLPLPPKELAIHLSKGKAAAVASKNPDAVVIGADTFVVYNGVLIGKPHTPSKAIETLQMLSGKVHTIVTGFTIIHKESGRSVEEAVETKVYFKKLTLQEIEEYVETGESLDNAGAYAILENGKAFVEKVEGDYLNIAGLPVSAVLGALQKFGITI